jgi:hypothetical protein
VSRETIRQRIERETREELDRGVATFTSGFSSSIRARQILVDATILEGMFSKGVKNHIEIAEGPGEGAKIVDVSFTSGHQLLVTYDRDVEEPIVMTRDCYLREEPLGP